MATPVHAQLARPGESLEEVLLGRIKLPLLERQGIGVVQKAQRARLPIQSLDRHPFVARSFELLSRGAKVLNRFFRLNESAVGLAYREVNDRGVFWAPLLLDKRGPYIDHLLQLPDRRQPLQLAQLRLALGQHGGRLGGQEEIERFARLACDQLQGLHRRPGASFLDQGDGGPGELSAGYLSERELGFTPRLLDRPRPDVDALASATVSGAVHGGEGTAIPCPRLRSQRVLFTGLRPLSRPGRGRPST